MKLAKIRQLSLKNYSLKWSVYFTYNWIHNSFDQKDDCQVSPNEHEYTDPFHLIS